MKLFLTIILLLSPAVCQADHRGDLEREMLASRSLNGGYELNPEYMYEEYLRYHALSDAEQDAELVAYLQDKAAILDKKLTALESRKAELEAMKSSILGDISDL
jgi:hypothetical protein